MVEFGRSGGGDALGGVAGVAIDLPASLAICRSNNGKAGGAQVDGGEVEAAYGVGMAALRGMKREGTGEAILGGEGASSRSVAGALGVDWGEKGPQVVGGEDGLGMVDGVGRDGVLLQCVVSGI